MGSNAMQALDDGSGAASTSMIMLLIINGRSIHLLPSTVIGLRASAGSLSPADIILPTILATTVTTGLGIVLVKICSKIFGKKSDKQKKFNEVKK